MSAIAFTVNPVKPSVALAVVGCAVWDIWRAFSGEPLMKQGQRAQSIRRARGVRFSSTATYGFYLCQCPGRQDADAYQPEGESCNLRVPQPNKLATCQNHARTQPPNVAKMRHLVCLWQNFNTARKGSRWSISSSQGACSKRSLDKDCCWQVKAPAFTRPIRKLKSCSFT